MSVSIPVSVLPAIYTLHMCLSNLMAYRLRWLSVDIGNMIAYAYIVRENISKGMQKIDFFLFAYLINRLFLTTLVQLKLS